MAAKKKPEQTFASYLKECEEAYPGINFQDRMIAFRTCLPQDWTTMSLQEVEKWLYTSLLSASHSNGLPNNAANLLKYLGYCHPTKRTFYLLNEDKDLTSKEIYCGPTMRGREFLDTKQLLPQDRMILNLLHLELRERVLTEAELGGLPAFSQMVERIRRVVPFLDEEKEESSDYE